MTEHNPHLVASEPTPLGCICLWQRTLPTQNEIVTELTLDNQFLMSSCVTASERALTERALELHSGTQLNVLVGGLGLGYTAHAALRSERVASVEVVEYLAPVISWFEQGLMPLAPEFQHNPRVIIQQGDVYARLAEPQAEQRFDLILVDVDHSPERPLGDQSANFYTEAGLRAAARHLADDGILGVWSYASDSAFSEALKRVFSEVRVEPITLVNEVLGDEQTDFLFLARRLKSSDRL